MTHFLLQSFLLKTGILLCLQKNVLTHLTTNDSSVIYWFWFQEKCAQYWPGDGVVVYGDISIELKREEESESYTVRDLLVTNNRVRQETNASLMHSYF